MAPSLWDNDTRETHDVARERKVEIQSKGICRASGKVYEKLMPESGKNLARRVKEIAVKRVARPRSK